MSAVRSRQRIAAAWYGRRLVVLLALTAALTACGGKDPVHFRQEGAPESPVPEVSDGVALERIWRVRLAEGYEAVDRVLEPGFDSARVYVADPRGQLQALDAASGERAWQRRVEARLVAGVGVGAGMVVVGDAGGMVSAFDTDSGDRLWSVQVGGDVSARPVIAIGRVIVRTADGQILGLDSATGEILWRVRRTVPSLSVYGDSEPLVHGRAMVNGLANGQLIAIDLDAGQVLWEVPVSRPGGRNEIEQMTDIDSDPVLVGTVMYVASFQGNLTAMALGSPQVLWTREVSTLREIGHDDDRIYITDDEGRIHAFNRFTGDSLWTQERLRGRGVTGALALNEALVVGDYQGYLYLLDPAQGNLIGRMSTGDGALMMAPMRHGERVYTLSENGTVSAWRSALAER